MPVNDRLVGTVERILYLKKFPPVEDLPAVELGVVASHMRERFFARGEALLRGGEPIGAIYLVVEGSVRLRRRGKDIGVMGVGNSVGGLGLFARDPEGLEAVAESDTLTLELDADGVLELFEDHFSILHHIMRETCRQLIGLTIRRRSFDAPELPQKCVTCPPRELDLVERIFFLRQAPPFTRSSINALAELSRGLTEVRFEPEVELWKEGDPGGGILLIVNGTVRCRMVRRGLEFRPGPGTPLGALESVGEVPRWYEATTETPFVALHGSVEGLFDVFEDNFEMAMDYLAVISRWVMTLLEEEGVSPEAESGEGFVRATLGS